MIKNIEIINFKAIVKGNVKLTPLTVFIGYNGTGKSSILEALETFQVIITDGLEKSMSRWRKFEHILYKGKKKHREFVRDGFKFKDAPMEFKLNLSADGTALKLSSSISQEKTGANLIYFIEEKLTYNNQIRIRNAENKVFLGDKELMGFEPDKSLITGDLTLRKYIESWQFLSMNTFLMGNPYPQKRTGGKIKLNHDGSNIAEYVLAIRDSNSDIFQGIIETIQFVLPYASDIQPVITEELEKMVYMQLTEQEFKVPGWLLSTGTLKVLALLAVFRNPNPSPLIVIEELENGLDPRTINLIIGEIREFIKDKKSQVIITTHSPYLLDLLHLSQIVFVEREDGNVVFKRPYDVEAFRKWSKDYTPGELYEKDLLQQYLK